MDLLVVTKIAQGSYMADQEDPGNIDERSYWVKMPRPEVIVPKPQPPALAPDAEEQIWSYLIAAAYMQGITAEDILRALNMDQRYFLEQMVALQYPEIVGLLENMA